MHFKTFERRPGLLGALRDLFRWEYTLIQALDNISLAVQGREVVGYIGPNGAGKSTTLKIVAGVLHPTEGSVRVNGLDPWTQREEHCRLIGVLFGHRSQLGWNLPVLESFRFLREIYGVPERDFRRRLDSLVETLNLEPLLRLPVQELSLGQFDGSLEAIKRRYSPHQKRLTLRFIRPQALAQAQGQLQTLKISDCDFTIREEGLSLELTLRSEMDVQTILQAIPQEGLRDLSVEDPRIEDVVLTIYKSRDRDRDRDETPHVPGHPQD